MAEQKKELKIETPSFYGGMNTSVQRRDIRDHELFVIQNMEFDDSSDLISRNGFTTDGTGRSSKISSVYIFNTETAFVGILNSFGASLSSRPLVLGAETDLSGGLPGGIPNNTRWYWKQLANTAVAVMGGPTVKVVGGAPGTASALAAAPDGKYIEEWKSRLFIVHVSNPNRVQCSDLGSATSWNTGGLTNPAQGITFDVAPGDGDVITGLFAFKERLFIFKKRRIYVLRITALPETDPTSWEVVEYSKVVGSVSQSSIREVFDDVVFLSEAGLCSLAAAEMTADFASALISQKIKDIQRIKQDASELDIFAVTLPDKSQYWLCIQSTAHPTGSTITYVLDYRHVKEVGIRWTQFTRLVPTAMDAYRVGQSNIVYVLGHDGGGSDRRIGKYTANLLPASRIYKDTLNGSDLTVNYNFTTKTYNMGYTDLRKLFKKWILGIEHPGTADIDLTVTYSIYPVLPATSGISYGAIHIDFNILYDAFRNLRRALLWDKTRKGWAIDFTFSLQTISQGMIIRHFTLIADLLDDPITEDIIT